MRLKADLHLHTREGEAPIAYDALTLIDWAARDGYQVLAITNHNVVTWSEALSAYARERGILLIPGVEATIERKHVLLYNIDVRPSRVRTFAELRRLKGSGWLVVAAHPFFPGPTHFGNRLLDEIDLFDGIEFSHFYTTRIDFNRPAARLAQVVGLPLLGSSDSHLADQFGTTYSLIDAEPEMDSVLTAIRKGAVDVVSSPLSLRRLVGITARLFLRSHAEEARDQSRVLADSPGMGN